MIEFGPSVYFARFWSTQLNARTPNRALVVMAVPAPFLCVVCVSRLHAKQLTTPQMRCHCMSIHPNHLVHHVQTSAEFSISFFWVGYVQKFCCSQECCRVIDEYLSPGASYHRSVRWRAVRLAPGLAFLDLSACGINDLKLALQCLIISLINLTIGFIL